jgi:hypothetical protein
MTVLLYEHNNDIIMTASIRRDGTLQSRPFSTKPRQMTWGKVFYFHDKKCTMPISHALGTVTTTMLGLLPLFILAGFALDAERQHTARPINLPVKGSSR